MTRRDYELIANVFHQTKPAEHWDANKRVQWELDVSNMATRLTPTNPRFDRARFLKACGVEV